MASPQQSSHVTLQRVRADIHRLPSYAESFGLAIARDARVAGHAACRTSQVTLADPWLPDYAGLRSHHQQQPPGTDLDAQSWSLSTSFGDRDVGEP